MHDYKMDGGKKHLRTLAMLCEDESLSDTQLKAYQTRFQEYRTFLEAVTRLASCGNVCITEESVMVGENGLLNGESLNALQHAGAISVYNALQQNNWEFPVPEEGDVAVIRSVPDTLDKFLDSENSIRSDWPAIYVSDCFIEGEKAKLHGSVKPLRTFLPPSVLFRNAADIDESMEEPDSIGSSMVVADDIEIINSQKGGLAVRRTKKEKGDVEILSVEDYFYGKQGPNPDYKETKAEYKFKCAVCQRMFTSNVKLMYHILEHVDETCPALMCFDQVFSCQSCQLTFESAYDLKVHHKKFHSLGKEQQTFYNPDTGEAYESDAQMGQLNKAEFEFECKICDKECPTELSLAHHLQFTHRYKEMPYVCKLCLFRSSVYEDILEHFYNFHEDTNNLLCAYCLRIYTPTDARPAGQSPPSQSSVTGAVTTVGLGAGVGQTQVYLQHLRMHQVKHHVRSCGCCKLNFTNKSDFQMHRRLDHRSVLPNNPYPSEMRMRTDESSQKAIQEPPEKVNKEPPQQTANMVLINGQLMQVVEGDEEAHAIDLNSQMEVDYHEEIITNPITGLSYKAKVPANAEVNKASEIKSPEKTLTSPNAKYSRLKAATMYNTNQAEKQPAKPLATAAKTDSKSISLNAPEAARMKDLSGVSFNRPTNRKHPCLECDKFLMDGDHRRYLPCSACRFATCCAAAFNRHVKSMHIRFDSKLSTSDHQKAMPFLKPMRFAWLRVVGKTGFKSANPPDSSNEEASLEVKNPRELKNYPVKKFHCKRCGFSSNDGNKLACHLVEECGCDSVTLKPTEELLKIRESLDRQHEEELARQAEIVAQRRAHEEGIKMHETVTLDSAGEHNLELNQEILQQTEEIESGHNVEEQTAIVYQTLGVLEPNQTIELTNDQGEVFQTLSWPEDTEVKEDQIIVIMQGEDGLAQLAIVSKHSYDPDTNQVILPAVDEQQQMENPETMEIAYEVQQEQ